MRSEVILSTLDLWAGYGGKPILQGLDIQIRAGEIVAVIGRNGVGKSTLMRTIIGLVPAVAGSVAFKGDAVDRLAAHQRARLGIGYVPQGRDVFPRLSVAENMTVGEVGRSRVDAAERDQVLQCFPILGERWRQQAGTLSGGQQQQLAIARVLVAAPSLILLDEPSEGVQPSIVQDIARTMVALNHTTGVTIVLVEQNIDMIRAMAQRCYVLDKGRIVAELDRSALADGDAMRRHLSV